MKVGSAATHADAQRPPDPAAAVRRTAPRVTRLRPARASEYTRLSAALKEKDSEIEALQLRIQNTKGFGGSTAPPRQRTVTPGKGASARGGGGGGGGVQLGAGLQPTFGEFSGRPAPQPIFEGSDTIAAAPPQTPSPPPPQPAAAPAPAPAAAAAAAAADEAREQLAALQRELASLKGAAAAPAPPLALTVEIGPRRMPLVQEGGASREAAGGGESDSAVDGLRQTPKVGSAGGTGGAAGGRRRGGRKAHGSLVRLATPDFSASFRGEPQRRMAARVRLQRAARRYLRRRRERSAVAMTLSRAAERHHGTEHAGTSHALGASAGLADRRVGEGALQLSRSLPQTGGGGATPPDLAIGGTAHMDNGRKLGVPLGGKLDARQRCAAAALAALAALAAHGAAPLPTSSALCATRGASHALASRNSPLLPSHAPAARTPHHAHYHGGCH